MPERIFKFQTVPELLSLGKSLSVAITTGSTNALRNNNSGFFKQSSGLTVVEIRAALRDVRYEIYCRGLDGDAYCASLEPKNPLQERVMRVEHIYAPPYFLVSPYGA